MQVPCRKHGGIKFTSNLVLISNVAVLEILWGPTWRDQQPGGCQWAETVLVSQSLSFKVTSSDCHSSKMIATILCIRPKKWWEWDKIMFIIYSLLPSLLHHNSFPSYISYQNTICCFYQNFFIAHQIIKFSIYKLFLRETRGHSVKAIIHFIHIEAR